MPLASCGHEKRKLGVADILGLASWILLFVSCACAILLVELQAPAAADVDRGLRHLSVGLHATIVLATAAGASCYVYVSSKAPRPRLLHFHGLFLMLYLPEVVALIGAQTLHHERKHIASRFAFGCGFAIGGIRGAFFHSLMMKKLAELGPSSHRCCLKLRFWGRMLIVSTLLSAICGGAAIYFWRALLLIRGCTDCEDDGTGLPTSDKLGPVDRVVLAIFVLNGVVGAVGISVAGMAFILVTVSSIRFALSKMVKRNVTKEPLQAVRRTLWFQLWGIAAAIGSIFLVIIANFIKGLSRLDEDVEEAVNAAVLLVHVAGEITGLFLLSGIGMLILRESPEAGDITGHIRSVLHSAVLTSQAEVVFEGHVATTLSNCCIVSFPGKFLSEWNALTWLCEQGELSSACVFLPTTDPKMRFGQHVDCPETPGTCWCHSLYGEEKPWGCLWFEAWRSNIEEAVALHLDLVVVFFPKQAGKGQVNWEDLAVSELWDGVGLGGSQKAEVAYLKKKGYDFIEEDLDMTRRRITAHHIRRNRSAQGR